MDADLLVFDPEVVQDQATYEEPTRLATGIDLVYIGGVKVLEEGKHTGAAAGKVLRKGR
jgi:N-acyl-D-aspartate/D-glutamate deacylase